VLVVVAIATAFSGFLGTQWGGEQARLYGLASSTDSRDSWSAYG
jgi:hypothetical protein